MRRASVLPMSIRGWLWASLFLWVACIFLAPQARAESAAELSREAQSALDRLYQQEPKTRVLGNKAVGVLVFPRILKGGLLVGAETGDGALIRRGKVQAYYNISAVSFGLQAGAQEFSYALFFMNEPAMRYLDQSDGWSLGAGPSLVVVDDSYAASITTTTLSQDVYAVPFGGQGLMAGMGLEGSKITRTQPD
ncbi:lipid-binding SYLF domain-containing protein [Achromobacter sp. ACM04]|uniref:Uncharacterized conserved protein n=2 Tax=Achromobacter aegrifaciens TaxID=1287736 RepID=A0AAD2J329_ACHAE|nr:lipid-binding SYLF domain-containing protein [Achromobacter sp. ACM02]MBD9418337.1 lipid-binding SYLF domain-containing protein [Achromobacter sp. ACM04]MBD9428729.1 lipid-binding SYLF domain-containing protein [Achromobacter sp. ACM03]MBD9473410.1 lipid-binding SYLF domain-containing protein [Achromobacter sp. ACM01]PTN48430.1 twin-arginine translocation pathway signal protein [Achromobacter xylosoxidans]CAB3636309.1 hypothetical protein LMG26852_01395 [Achromobacter aegrifaciens]